MRRGDTPAVLANAMCAPGQALAGVRGVHAVREILSAVVGDHGGQRVVGSVEAHVRGLFAGRGATVEVDDLGSGRREVVPGLRVLTVSPGPRADSWAYVTAGCWPVAERDGHARILWALPVTVAEMAYRREHGHEALEQLFDEHAIVPTDPKGRSIA